LTRINFEKIVKVERDKIFKIVTDYEKLQKTIPQYFTSVRVISSRDNVTVIEEHLNLAGYELVMMTKHVKKFPEIHEVFVIGGDAKGSHIIEKYEKIPGGTKITVDADLKLRGPLKIVAYFAKSKITKGFSRIMDEFAKIAENQLD